MTVVAIVLGTGIILMVLWDGFETVILPRRVTRRVRFARVFYKTSWLLWRTALRSIGSDRRRDAYRSYFAPLSLLMLLALWACAIILGYSLLYWACGSTIKSPDEPLSFATTLYLSGSTFFTLGLGDVLPVGSLARTLAVVEAGMGFAFLALLIGHLPGLNQSFAQREVNISLLDARAGSPPTAFEVLGRHVGETGTEVLQQFFRDWEKWSAELLESHLSYPVLAYYRSQHDNQSWLAALTAILDSCALTIACMEGTCTRQARLTFAMARHAVVDLALVLRIEPHRLEGDRLPADELARLRAMLAATGLHLRDDPEADEKLAALRLMYEPYVLGLSEYLAFPIPGWIPPDGQEDNWRSGPWDEFLRAEGKKRRGGPVNGHF